MTTAAATARPRPPARSPVVPIGLVAFVALTAWATIGIDFDLSELVQNVARGRQILGELLNPTWSFLPQTVGPMLETFKMAVIASAFGCSVALPISFLASRVTTPNLATYLTNRGVMSVIRAIPDLLYAMIFVAAVSVGPLGGILALFLFNIGVVAKLLSETVDGVDLGPIEAARASGANRVQTTSSAVLPQVLPNYVAYSLYVFELNIRASTVIGFVGAGGIGFLLQSQLRFFAYENISVIVVELFLFVFIIESISIWLRRRLV